MGFTGGSGNPGGLARPLSKAEIRSKTSVCKAVEVPSCQAWQAGNVQLAGGGDAQGLGGMHTGTFIMPLGQTDHPFSIGLCAGGPVPQQDAGRSEPALLEIWEVGTLPPRARI